MSLTIAEIEALMNDEPIGEEEVEFLSQDELDALLDIDDDYKSISKSVDTQNNNLKKNLAKFENIFFDEFILEYASAEGFKILQQASYEPLLSFGETFKANLEGYENMTTRYLKQANVSYKDTTTPLIIHYQSNFPYDTFELHRLDEIFPIFEVRLKSYYETLSLSPILEEITYTPPDESEPILSYAFDFFDANDLRGQFLISIPYNNFLQWEEMEEYQVFDQNDLEKAEELDELEDVLANLNKSRFVEEGFEEY
jgi:hypothetical protein